MSSHRRADTVKGSKLSYTTVAMKCEPIVCSSLLTLAGVVLADPEPMLPPLVRGCIALASLLTCPLISPATPLLIPSRAASSAT